MESVAFIVAEVIPFIIDNQLDYGPFWEIRWFIKQQTPFLHSRAKTTHMHTVQPQPDLGQPAHTQFWYNTNTTAK
ncbi:MAG TPA: hypothetical protein VJ728_17665 [Candidatus Binataceae bacterium]|nr:hypothetical protein [Candidatus Binataceae bacterium]